MILTCPNCTTRYLVDPRSLGAAGRTVRCAHCAHTWHQSPPEDAPRPVEIPDPPRVSPLDPVTRAEAEPELRAARLRPLLGWLMPLLGVAVLAGGLVSARDTVVGFWPPAAQLYGLVGLAPEQPRTGLELRKVVPSRDVENGLPTLVIQGEVANTSSVAREVPKLHVMLRDASGGEVQSWSFSVTDERLLPGASIPFRTSIAQPSDAATGVVVIFANGGE